MGTRIGHITLETFVQATEDEGKVLTALSNLAGADVSEMAVLTRTEGFHKNPLVVVMVELERDRDIRTAFEALLSSDGLRKALKEEGGPRLDEENVFHYRFDKGSAYLGTAAPLIRGESVKLTMKVLTYPFSRDAALEFLGELAGKVDMCAGRDIIALSQSAK